MKKYILIAMILLLSIYVVIFATDTANRMDGSSPSSVMNYDTFNLGTADRMDGSMPSEIQFGTIAEETATVTGRRKFIICD